MPHCQDGKTLPVYFFKSPSGNEPVKDWLKHRTTEEKKVIGEDIKAVGFLWPVGYPHIVKPDKDLWEIRTNVPDGICRVFFTIWKGYMVLLHSIIKKTQKTPQQDLYLAKKCQNIIMAGGISDE
jgi:phage-related protein